MALVQACQDARRAYRNWFDPCPAGGRAARSAPGVPAQARRHPPAHPERFRRARARLYVAKVGDVRVQWSRDLPSAPSSVTVIREPDGRYYASFVVERAATPLPACHREIGVDVGLSGLAVTSDGEVIGNPRFLRAKERKLGPCAAGAVQQAGRLREPGESPATGRGGAPQSPGNPARPRAQDGSAAGPRQPSGLRRGHCVSGWPAPGWPGPSTTRAGLSCVRLIEGKAAQYGRTFVRTGRFEPTSQVCSACGVKDGPKPLHCPPVDVRGMRDGPRPGRERSEEHLGRRAGGQVKRLWRDVRPGHAWRLPVKQEPTGARREPRWRNPRRSGRGGRQSARGGGPGGCLASPGPAALTSLPAPVRPCSAAIRPGRPRGAAPRVSARRCWRSGAPAPGRRGSPGRRGPRRSSAARWTRRRRRGPPETGTSRPLARASMVAGRGGRARFRVAARVWTVECGRPPRRATSR